MNHQVLQHSISSGKTIVIDQRKFDSTSEGYLDEIDLWFCQLKIGYRKLLGYQWELVTEDSRLFVTELHGRNRKWKRNNKS